MKRKSHHTAPYMPLCGCVWRDTFPVISHYNVSLVGDILPLFFGVIIQTIFKCCSRWRTNLSFDTVFQATPCFTLLLSGAILRYSVNLMSNIRFSATDIITWVLRCMQDGFPLTHWGRDKMAAIFQTTFSNAFSWMKMFKFRLRFHWSLFPRVN